MKSKLIVSKEDLYPYFNFDFNEADNYLNLDPLFVERKFKIFLGLKIIRDSIYWEKLETLHSIENKTAKNEAEILEQTSFLKKYFFQNYYEPVKDFITQSLWRKKSKSKNVFVINVRFGSWKYSSHLFLQFEITKINDEYFFKENGLVFFPALRLQGKDSFIEAIDIQDLKDQAFTLSQATIKVRQIVDDLKIKDFNEMEVKNG